MGRLCGQGRTSEEDVALANGEEYENSTISVIKPWTNRLVCWLLHWP